MQDLQPFLGLTTKCLWLDPYRESTDYGPEHLTDIQGRAYLNVWSTECQVHRRKQQDRTQRTHSQPQDRKISDLPEVEPGLPGLEGRDSIEHATTTESVYFHPV